MMKKQNIMKVLAMALFANASLVFAQGAEESSEVSIVRATMVEELNSALEMQIMAFDRASVVDGSSRRDYRSCIDNPLIEIDALIKTADRKGVKFGRGLFSLLVDSLKDLFQRTDITEEQKRHLSSCAGGYLTEWQHVEGVQGNILNHVLVEAEFQEVTLKLDQLVVLCEQH